LPDERWFPTSIAQNDFVVSRDEIADQISSAYPGFVLENAGDYSVPLDLESANRNPPRGFLDGAIAFRLSGTWRETDWDLYHYSGAYTGPNADLSARVVGSIGFDANVVDLELSKANVMITQAHDVTHMTGVDVATSFGGATVRGEAAVFLDRPYLRATDTLVHDSVAK